jgi:hypothetical protein
MPAETISPEQAASLVESGMWLDYGATHGSARFLEVNTKS